MAGTNYKSSTMIKERILKLKDLFKVHSINGYIVPSTDEYLSEYVPDFAKRLEYISGFNGSNGICIILDQQALFFTDGRYLEQSKNQLDLSFFKIFDLNNIKSFPFNQYMSDNDVIGYDPRLLTSQTLKIFNNLLLKPIIGNLIDEIWPDQPSRPNSTISIYPEEFAGQSYSEKINLCRKAIIANSAKALVLTSSDSICWLLNLRASDIEFSPLMLGYVIIFKDEIYLFVEPARVGNSARTARLELKILPEEQFQNFLKGISGKVLIDEKSASIFIIDSLTDRQHIEDPCKLPKACKNNIEIKHAIDGHIKDGVALCEFFARLKDEKLDDLTEYDLGINLSYWRSQQEGYVTDSFPAICGFNENSAIIHYRALEGTAKKIQGKGLLLVDSGGQYMGATTDITRTISIGTPGIKEKHCYTNILRGHIALSQIKFPYGTSGANLDIIARQFLWAEGLDYPHSTGHGVGSFLSVHEGPHGINLKNTVPLEAGMILSNEPGYYVPGKFGIRIENLMYVKRTENSNFLQFETLSLVPYARELIDFNILTSSEIEYLKQYYQKIHDKLYHLLSHAAKEWLKTQITF